MARKFDAQPLDPREPITGCEAVIRGIYGERRCGDMVQSHESGQGLCHAHLRNWLLVQDDIRRTNQRARRYLVAHGVLREGMTSEQRMQAMREFRANLKRRKAETGDPLEWARLIVSRVADGERLPLLVEQSARRALEMDVVEVDG